eukprot:6213047-Pleurochrysis_carterae.AAC.1
MGKSEVEVVGAIGALRKNAPGIAAVAPSSNRKIQNICPCLMWNEQVLYDISSVEHIYDGAILQSCGA